MGDTQEINKAAARRLYEEAISQGKVEVLNDIVADDARDTAAPVDGGLPSGRGGFIRHVTWLLQAVEGVKATVTDTIAEDDRVVVYWTIDGIQREEVFGQVQAGKLAWVSPISGRRMFVNRRGARFCVASPEQLATMVRLGRLRLHRDEDAFYSAMQSVVDSLDTPAAA